MHRRTLLLYAALVGLPLVALALILRAGSGVDAAVAATFRVGSPAASSLGLQLLQVIIIVAVARAAGALLHQLGQPRVVGEMLAGVALGPSLLGAVAPQVWMTLFPVGSLAGLRTMSMIGLLLFMFLIGLELDSAALRANGRAAFVVSHASISIPLVLGGALALWLYPRYAEGHAPFRAFAL